MYTEDWYEEYFDEIRDDDGDAELMWSNPDVPTFGPDGRKLDDDAEYLVEQETVTFDCPYYTVDPISGNKDWCDNDFEFNLSDDPSKNARKLRRKIKSAGGTLRCDECNEPIYGFWGDGDHD